MTLVTLAASSVIAYAESPKTAASIESDLKEQLGKLEKTPESREKAMKIFSSATEEIDAYLKANPEAKDALAAKVLQVQLYAALQQEEKAAAMLPDLYKQLPKGKDGDLKNALPVVAILSRTLIEKGDKKAAKELLESFEKDFADHPGMSEMGERFLGSIRGKLNQPGPGDTMEIAFTAIDGTKVDLAAMKGKVVLVDFWATWCGPCVGELPNVKKAYTAYHEKGFEIVAISLDQEKETLEAFIKKEGMAWPQAFDGKGWGNEIAKKFGINSIPATFLVGKDGKVVATDLRGEALETKLAELLK